MIDIKWKENVILVDADYVDKVAFDLTVNFERMIGRRIPQADMARWIECVALDGGMRPTGQGQEARSTQVVFLHRKDKQQMDNFQPGHYAEALDGKAFSGELGEFLMSCVPVEEMVTTDDLFVDSLQVIANAEHIYQRVREVLRHADDEKRITVLTMQPMEGGNFRQEILGYSLMAALGIKADEIHE